MTTQTKSPQVIQVAKIDLLNQCTVKSREELTDQVCAKISRLNMEMDKKEVFSTLMKGGRIYTTAYCYKIL